MDDESQREEMNAAIRAQRERGAVPRSMLPPEDEPAAAAPAPAETPAPAPAPEPPARAPEAPAPTPPATKRSLLDRLLGR